MPTQVSTTTATTTQATTKSKPKKKSKPQKSTVQKSKPQKSTVQKSKPQKAKPKKTKPAKKQSAAPAAKPSHGQGGQGGGHGKGGGKPTRATRGSVTGGARPARSFSRHDCPVRVDVVGAGVMGLAVPPRSRGAATRSSCTRQFDLDHARGSSHGRSRIFRLAYPDEQWVALAQEALVGWRELEHETGEELLVLDGLLEVETSEAALDACGVAWQAIEPDEAARRFGVNTDGRALLQPDAGYVRADRARHAFIATGGFEVREESRVSSLGDLDADVVVVTAGSWAAKLLEPEGIELPWSRRARRSRTSASWNRSPR